MPCCAETTRLSRALGLPRLSLVRSQINVFSQGLESHLQELDHLCSFLRRAAKLRYVPRRKGRASAWALLSWQGPRCPPRGRRGQALGAKRAHGAQRTLARGGDLCRDVHHQGLAQCSPKYASLSEIDTGDTFDLPRRAPPCHGENGTSAGGRHRNEEGSNCATLRETRTRTMVVCSGARLVRFDTSTP